MKKYYKFSDLCHAWAYGHSNNGEYASMYFSGATIYSYGSHFPIAMKLDNGKILFTERSYSNTTAKHIGHVRSAVSDRDLVYVPDLANFVDRVLIQGNIKYKEKWDRDQRKRRVKEFMEMVFRSYGFEAERAVASLKTARKPEIYLGVLSSVKYRIDKIIEAIGLETYPIPKELAFALQVADKDKAAEFLGIKAVEIEKRRKAEVRRQKQEANKQAEEALLKYAKWKAGERVNMNYYQNVKGIDGNAFLRIMDGNIETSKGNTLSLEQGKDLYEKLQEIRGMVLIDLSIPVQTLSGKFTLTSVNEKTFTAGCNTIAFTEADEIAKQLGWKPF